MSKFAPPSSESEVPMYPPLPQTMPPGATIHVTAPTVPLNFGPQSQCLVCPHCHHSITTKVESKATTKTHMIALVLCLCLCWLCCCCPYCIDSCQSRNHYCPQCNAFLGSYNN